MAGGGLVGAVVAGMKLQPASLPGDYESVQYMAVGPTKVGFFSIKVGLFKNKIGELLVEYPRSDVQTLEIQKGVMPVVHIVLKDGTHFVFVCARIQLKKLKAVQELLVAQE